MLPVNESTLETFTETGIAKLHNVFSAEDADRMRDVVWRDLFHTEGVRREDRTTWQRASPRRKLARAKRDPIFRAMFGAELRVLADICHPGTVHCKPPNASDRPRFLRGPTLVRTSW